MNRDTPTLPRLSWKICLAVVVAGLAACTQRSVKVGGDEYLIFSSHGRSGEHEEALKSSARNVFVSLGIPVEKPRTFGSKKDQNTVLRGCIGDNGKGVNIRLYLPRTDGTVHPDDNERARKLLQELKEIPEIGEYYRTSHTRFDFE